MNFNNQVKCYLNFDIAKNNMCIECLNSLNKYISYGYIDIIKRNKDNKIYIGFWIREYGFVNEVETLLTEALNWLLKI